MIDLHQGITGEEAGASAQGLGGLAFAQLDVASAVFRGQLALAARKQVAVWALLGRVLWARLRGLGSYYSTPSTKKS
jgi:hypothetical protein